MKRLSAVTGKPGYWVFMEAGGGRGGERGEPKTKGPDEKKEKMLFLFNQPPEEEKKRGCLHTKKVLQKRGQLQKNAF
ncbi:transcriptional regulator, partial [Salmonella enterica]|uniref:transcriptional regulator n=1 Tax=Salmonella enterica TaxID=28901 RepID=UPI001112C8D9